MLKNKTKINKILYAVLSLLTISVPYVLLGPMEIYSANILEFKFRWPDFVIPCILFVMIFTLLLGTCICLLSDKWYCLITNFFIFVGFLSYVQAMFMNIKLVEENGNQLDFQSIGIYRYINIMIWIISGIVFIVLFKVIDRNIFKKICIALSVFLVVVQFSAFLYLIITTDSNPDSGDYMFTAENQFTLSESDNILILILDSYSNKLFNYASDNIENFEEPLKDFTYYCNADSCYIPTFPAMVHLLTGVDFYWTESRDEWMDYAWNVDSVERFYEIIHKNGYDINYFTRDTDAVIGSYENVADKFDNAEKLDVRVDNFALSKLIVKMSAFKYVPYVLKPYCEVLTYEYENVITYLQKSAPYDNEDYYDELMYLAKNGFEIGHYDKNVINITHIVGAHKIEELEDSLETQRFLMKIISAYLD